MRRHSRQFQWCSSSLYFLKREHMRSNGRPRVTCGGPSKEQNAVTRVIQTIQLSHAEEHRSNTKHAPGEKTNLHPPLSTQHAAYRTSYGVELALPVSLDVRRFRHLLMARIVSPHTHSAALFPLVHAGAALELPPPPPQTRGECSAGGGGLVYAVPGSASAASSTAAVMRIS